MDISRKVPVQMLEYQLQEIEGEVLLHNVRDTKTIYLNATSALIWRLVDGNNTVKEIVEHVQSLYPNADTDLSLDVTQVINELLSHGAFGLE